jgi:uncharacterized RDD family membrane protein YckC
MGAMACLCWYGTSAVANDTPQSQDESGNEWHEHRIHHSQDGDHENSVVNVGGNSTLAAGQQADDVVSIMGSSTSAGEVSESVVSIAGNTHVTGPVGENAVAVLGNVYVDSKVDGDVVAVLGNVDLGPHADVGGNLVSVGGTVTRDPNAQVHGDVNVTGMDFGGGGHILRDRFRPWIQHCLMLGRPLAFASGLDWAWTLALVALALYVFWALLFGGAVDRCVKTLEEHPGASLLTMLISMVGIPVAFILLVITVIGILVVPFLGMALLLATIFGKLVMLAWIGSRLLKPAAVTNNTHTALAVLIGGVIVLLLYVVPVLGFLVYKLLGLFGLGVVIYTLLLISRESRTGPAAAPASAPIAPAVLSSSAEAPAAGTAGATAAADSTAQSTSAKAQRLNPAEAIALPRAGFWIRMVALLLDVILVAIVVHAINASDDWYLLLLATYGAVMWKIRGSTVGGIVFNLEVVRHDGREMDWGTTVVRALSSFLSLIVIGLGFIWIAIDPENRAWHDKIAGTLVVRVP